MLVNLVAAVLFVLVAHVDYAIAALIAVGAVIGGQIGATVGQAAALVGAARVHRRGRGGRDGAVPHLG